MVKPIAKWFNHSSLAVVAAASFAACLGPRANTPPPSPSGTPLERKLAQDPNDKQVNVELGVAAEQGGDLLRAQQYYERAEALGVPADEIVPRIVRVLVGARRYDEALDRCRRRLQAKPDDRATRFVEAALLVALERPMDAERELSALMRTKPDDPQAYLALGKLYRDGYNDRPRARVMFEKYLALAPNGDDAAAVRFDLAGDTAELAAPQNNAAPNIAAPQNNAGPNYAAPQNNVAPNVAAPQNKEGAP